MVSANKRANSGMAVRVALGRDDDDDDDCATPHPTECGLRRRHDYVLARMNSMAQVMTIASFVAESYIELTARLDAAGHGHLLEGLQHPDFAEQLVDRLDRL